MIRSPKPQSSTTKSFGFTAGGGRSTNDHVVFAQHDHLWLPGFGLRSIHRGEAHDGEPVARFSEPGGGAVEDDLAGAGFGGDRVGLKALTVRHVAAEDSLVRQQTDFVHEVPGYAQAAFIVHVAPRYPRAVDLRLQDMNEHNS